jgi:hypothetical protein
VIIAQEFKLSVPKTTSYCSLYYFSSLEDARTAGFLDSLLSQL